MLYNTRLVCNNEVYQFKEKQMTKGFKYRMGVKIWNTGIRYKLYWIMVLGDKLKRKGMDIYV